MKNNEERELDFLKNQIGFKTAFKATLGFYVGQLVATILGLFFIGAIMGLSYLVYKIVG